MTSYLDFLVEPFNGRYNNKKKVGDKNLILNTELQNHQYTNRIGKVVKLPYYTEKKFNIKVGDFIVVHHNVFRRYRDIRGVEKNSRSYFQDNLYFVRPDQLYAYKSNISDDWKALDGFNLAKPIKETKMFSINFEKPLMGILHAVDKKAKEFSKGDLIGFKPNSEYEFILGNDRFYRVPTNSITIKYEYQGDEEEYNPSWASGS